MRKLILGLALVLMGAATLATAQPLTLTVGAAGQDGSVQFQLVANDMGQSTLNVHVNVSGGDSSGAIASKIVTAVNNYSPNWSASLPNGSVTAVAFKHFGGQVGVVLGLLDTASASLTLSSSCPALSALAINPTAKASGAGTSGGSSFLTFSVPGASAPYTVVLAPAQTSKSIVDGICAYLAGHSVPYTRVSDTKVKIATQKGSFSVQTNDSGLQGAVTLSDAWDTQSGLIDR